MQPSQCFLGHSPRSQSTREVRLKTDRGTPSIWLMGMCNATMGFSNGMVLFALPQLLAAEHVPEWQIAAITAVAFSPNFWSVLFAPILDVRFSRRWYATVLAFVCAISTAAGVLSLHHLVRLEIAMLVSIATSILSSSAMGELLSNITAQKDKNILSKWMNISLISGIGVTSMVGGQLVRHLPMLLAATLVGVIVFSSRHYLRDYSCSRPRPPSRRRKLHSIQSRSPLSFASSRSLDRAASLSVAVRFFCTHEFARRSRRRFSRLSERYQHRWRHRSLHFGNRWLRALSDHRQAPTAALVLSRERHCRQHLHSEPNYSAALDRYIRSGPVRRIPIPGSLILGPDWNQCSKSLDPTIRWRPLPSAF